MPTALQLALNELDAADLEAVTQYAMDVVRAGEWSDDIGRVLAHMVAANHPDDVDAYLEKVGRELERHQTL